jgi:hypothetical protein
LSPANAVMAAARRKLVRRNRILHLNLGSGVTWIVADALPDVKRNPRRPARLARHAAKEGEGLDQTGQDRLGPLGRQRDGEGTIGKRPRHHEYGYLLTSLGEVHVDVTKVGFETLTGIVVKRDERFALAALPIAHLQPHALVAAGVAMLLLEPPLDLLAVCRCLRDASSSAARMASMQGLNGSRIDGGGLSRWYDLGSAQPCAVVGRPN